MLTVTNLTKTYSSESKSLTVLSDVSFSLESGKALSIVGASGSGKTTLLGLCAGLDKPSSGSVLLNNILLDRLDEDQRGRVRSEFTGFVFQNFQLLPTLSALENIMVPMEIRREQNVKKRALDLLGRVGLSDRGNHYPTQLSGGEQQRISIARAFSNSPKILFADEPTGNLDEETSENIQALLFEFNREAGTTLVMVTHDMELAQKADQIIRLKGGILQNDTTIVTENG